MVKVEYISYQHQRTPLLHNVHFSLLPGDSLAILGANGAGKSTLLKCLSRELNPTQGHIYLNNQSLKSWKNVQLAQCRAVLSQQYQLILPFTVQQVVMMGRYPHFKNHPLPHDENIVTECIRFAGIEQLRDRNYLTLSGGEQQRTQIARVLAQLWAEESTAGKLLLLDEPVSALDILYQHHIMQLIQKLALRNFTTITVLHDLNLAQQYCNKVLLLKNGQQLAFGDTSLLNASLIKEVYGVNATFVTLPNTPKKHIVITA